MKFPMFSELNQVSKSAYVVGDSYVPVNMFVRVKQFLFPKPKMPGSFLT